MCALRREDPVAIAVVGAARLVVGKTWSQRTLLLAGRCLPVQAVPLPRRADETLRIFQHAVAVAVLRGVLGLCVVISKDCLHGRQFIATDAPYPHYLLSGDGVEVPALCVRHDWDRQRPPMRPHSQEAGLVVVGKKCVESCPAVEELLHLVFFDLIDGEHFGVVTAQQRIHCLAVVARQGDHQSVGSLLWRLEIRLFGAGSGCQQDQRSCQRRAK